MSLVPVLGINPVTVSMRNTEMIKVVFQLSVLCYSDI